MLEKPTLTLLTAFLSLLMAGSAIAQSSKDIINDCFIEPSRVSELNSPLNGIVDKIAVSRGDAVAKDQVVVSLGSRIEEISVQLAKARAERDQAIESKKARVEFTQRRLERNRELYKKSLISEQIVDETETEALLAQLELGEFEEQRLISEIELIRARQALEEKKIRSPFAGVVVDVLVAPGESVENRALMKIAQLDPLYVEVIAPVKLFGKIKKGAKAKIFLEDPIGGEYDAQILIVDKVIDAASGTFGIRLQLDNKDNKLPAGLRCRAEFLP